MSLNLKNHKPLRNWNALETRTYRFKKVAFEFFCPLCRTQRAISTGHRLTLLNYLQIVLLSGLVTASSWPWIGLKGSICIFPIFALFGGVRRMLFSRGVPCPHCGFDASWYKRDVKVARRLVKDFWGDQKPVVVPEVTEESSTL